MSARFLHQSKAMLPILLMLAGIVTDFNDSQLRKAFAPILVTLSEITIEVSESQPAKASSPISVTLSGMIVCEQPCINVLVVVSIIALQLSRLSYLGLPSATMILFNALQPTKALSPISVTFAGIIILFNEVQISKA